MRKRRQQQVLSCSITLKVVRSQFMWVFVCQLAADRGRAEIADLGEAVWLRTY